MFDKHESVSKREGISCGFLGNAALFNLEFKGSNRLNLTATQSDKNIRIGAIPESTRAPQQLLFFHLAALPLFTENTHPS